MLAISDDAATAIRTILSAEGAPDGAGLRIAAVPTENGQAELGVGLATAPGESDQVVEHDGAHVFVGEEATQFLDDKMLDAREEDEQIAFTLADQAAG